MHNRPRDFQMIKINRLATFVAHILCLAIVSSQALAVLQGSEHSVTVIPAEGNGRCNDYGANDFVKEMGGSISCPSSTSVVWGRVSGPDSVNAELDPLDTSPESAMWQYDCESDQLRFYDSTVGINYTVTKVSRNVTWFPYGSVTWEGDSRIMNQDPSTGEVLPMASFALCYDLPDSDNKVEPQPLPNCNSDEGEPNDNVINAWLGAIDCTEVADGTVVTLWQPLDPDDPATGGASDRFFQCVCNDSNTVFTTDCDPEGESGDLPACYSKENGQPKATTIVEFDADPITCTTSGGDRTCKCVDNPFTPLVNECAQ